MKKQLSGFAYEAADMGAFSEKKASVKKDDGFTLVELLIVIVIIGILAAILIPTYTDLIKRANLSADQVAVRDMNMALKAAELSEGEQIGLGWARKVLSDAGFNGDNLIPTTLNHGFYWSDKYNIVLLVDCSDENQSEWFVVNVDGNNKEAAEEFSDITKRLLTNFDLADFPSAIVTPINVTLSHDDCFSGYGFDSSLSELVLDVALNFTENEPDIEASKYKDWLVDYRITISHDLNYEDDSGNKTRYFLAGQYESFSENWVVFEATGATKDTYYLLKTMGDVAGVGFAFTYKDICEIVKSFNCAVAIEGEHEGLVITLELIMYENAEALENGDYLVVSTFIYDHTGKN